MAKRKWVYITFTIPVDTAFGGRAVASSQREARSDAQHLRSLHGTLCSTVRLPAALWSRGPDHVSVHDIPRAPGKVFF